MTGHEKRAYRLKISIIDTAIELFEKYGVKKTSIDEIAEAASVSKVTIYKYFESKEGLIDASIEEIYRRKISAMENILNEKSDFMEKLRFLLNLKAQSKNYIEGAFLREFLHKEIRKFEMEINALMNRFLDEGKKQHYIDENCTNGVVLAYMEVFRKGLEIAGETMPHVLSDSKSYEELIHLFFFGLIRKS